jgi:hypothetical protein
MSELHFAERAEGLEAPENLAADCEVIYED